MRLPRLSAKLLIRIAALALAAMAIMRAAVELGDDPSRSASAAPSVVPVDAFAATLERCRHLTPDQASDAACRRAWAESRRRFLGSHTGHSV